jgi:hypothetical protein
MTTAITKESGSKPRKDFKDFPHSHRFPKLTVQRCQLCYGASSELFSLALAPLFVLQRCTVLL